MAVRSKEPQLSYEHLEQKIKYQENYINQLQHAIAQLNRHRFGRRSESFVNPLQAQLPFMKEEDEVKPEQVEQSISIEKHIRKKITRKISNYLLEPLLSPLTIKTSNVLVVRKKTSFVMMSRSALTIYLLSMRYQNKSKRLWLARTNARTPYKQP